MTTLRRFGWTAFAMIALAGCEPAAPPATPPVTPPVSSGASKDSAEKALPVGDKPGVTLTDKEIAAIKKLPEEDQKIATAQAVCPVSDEHLGEMGAPIKQVVDGKTFFLCCDSCEAKVKEDPKGVLAKLKK